MTADDVQRLFDLHMGSAFPARLRDEDAAGVDLVVLDADLAGCVATWLAGGRLDGRLQAVLRRCLRDADAALAALADPSEVAYVRHLRDLAAAVLA